MKKNEHLTDDIIVWALRAVNGEITHNMRMIAFSYSGNKATFRFYMSKPPSEEEKELGDIVAVNFEAGLSHKLDALDVEFVTTDEALGLLDNLDTSLFRRYE